MLLDNIRQSQATVLYMLPWLLENMVAEAEDQQQDTMLINVLRNKREVAFGGASVSAYVGNKLFSQGVPLVNIWSVDDASTCLY